MLYQPNFTFISLWSIVNIQLLNNSRCVLYDLGIVGGGCLREWLNDRSYHHLFEFLSALFVDTQITDGEESNPPWRLGRALVVGDDVQELLEGAVLNQISTQCI